MKSSEFLRIARMLIERAGKPMTPRELAEIAQNERLFSDKLSGKTPHQTMKSKLSLHVRNRGDSSTFVRTKPGRFFLRHLISDERAIFKTKPWQAPPPSERVLVLPCDFLDRWTRYQGVSRSWKQLVQALSAAPYNYVDRLTAEGASTYKQVLTYILVTRRSEILGFRRGRFSRVEDYLRGSFCVGFGGHVTEEDATLFSQSMDLGINDSAIRELGEELALPKTDLRLLSGRGRPRIIGVLNDDSSEVGRRHIAFILRYEVSDDTLWDNPRPGEQSVTQLRWFEQQTDIDLRNFEYWSQLCLRTFFPKLVKAQASFRLHRRRPLIPPHVLCVLGELGSGKSEATAVLRDQFGYREVNSGKVLASLIGIRPVPRTSRHTFQRAAQRFIQTPEGPELLASALWKRVASGPIDRVLVDGIRQQATLDYFKRFAANAGVKVGILFIHTPSDIAYELDHQRNRKSSLDDFLNVRQAPVEAEAALFIRGADAVIYNWIGRLEYQREVRALMQEIGVQRT